MTPDTSLAVVTAPRRDSRHWTAESVTWGELQEWAANPADRKECGNYLLGTLTPTTVVHPNSDGKECTDLHRRKVAVVSRSALTLDVDRPSEGFLDAVELLWPHAALAHTTWSSTPDQPRYRLIIPTDRDMAPDEYVAAAHAAMERFGPDNFDPSTDEAERYMFRPSARTQRDYRYVVLDGPAVPVDELLDGFEDDLSTKAAPAVGRNKRDPFTLEGVVGLFNRAYEDWDLLIEEYALPYEKVDNNRYQLSGARSQAGMGPVAGTAGLVYSHHANDPAYGQACSAFDLARLHLFGHMDEEAKPSTPVSKLPSHAQMLEVAKDDPRVARLRASGATDDFTPVSDDTSGLDDLLDDANAWKIGLRYNRNNQLTDEVANWDLVVANDPLFQSLRYNEISMDMESTTHMPWWPHNRATRVLLEFDRWGFKDYLEREYGLKSTGEKAWAQVQLTAHRNLFNPLRDYLEHLPAWDGVPRVETCLPGVRPTDRARLIARKVMVAAVARVLDPGCKWDHVLVLYGEEGLGKSWWVQKMARGFSASLGRPEHKDTLMELQRNWVLLADEGHSIQGDNEAHKEFITRTHDTFRAPYEKEMLVHPRHSVIWATTNDKEFLTRQEGNRRFLVVECADKVDFDGTTPTYIDQVWAEALHLYRSNAVALYMDAEEAKDMSAERENFMDRDLAGVIQEYLEQDVPAGWEDMPVSARMRWMADREDGFVPEGGHRINYVCSRQIWVEALRYGNIKPTRAELRQIFNEVLAMDGWVREGSRSRWLKGYGEAVVLKRKDPS